MTQVNVGANLVKAVAATMLALVLSGCGLGSSSTLSEGSGVSGGGIQVSVAKGSITGLVYGGQPPVTGAQVYLFATGTTGYTSANTSLLNAGVNSVQSGGYVLTDGGGGFSITGDYNCPATVNTPVYMLVLGGNPGLGVGGSNPNLALMAALGSCDVLKANAASTYVFINEVTTVAAVYALAPFANGTGVAFSSSASNFNGLTAAFANVPNIVSTSGGAAYALTPSAAGTVPQAKINSLANSLENCINSAGGTAGQNNACGNLFTATTVGGVAPTDTVHALLNIAKHPGLNSASTIYNLAPTTGAAFQPSLSSAPADWTMAISYTGGGISTPQALAIDGSGNAWVANKSNTVTKISAGSFVSGAGGYTSGSLDGPVSVAIDTTGNVWVSSCGSTCSGSANASSVTQYVPGSGNTVSPTNYTAGGLSATYSVAVTPANTVWVANTLGSSLTLLNNSGVPQSGTSGYTTTNLSYPTWVATDTSGNAWTVSPSQNAIVELNSTGSVLSGSYIGAALNDPTALAIDHTGRAWVTNTAGNSVAIIAAGASITNSPFSGAGILKPNAIAMDGAGSAWISNAGSTISELLTDGTAGSPVTGYTSTALTYANDIAVDFAGNVWVTNCGSYCTGTGSDPGSVLEFLGAAIPAATPLAMAAANNTLGSEP